MTQPCVRINRGAGSSAGLSFLFVLQRRTMLAFSIYAIRPVKRLLANSTAMRIAMAVSVVQQAV